MKIAIKRVGDNIGTFKDYSDIKGRGEIAHIIIELELIKAELLELWSNHEDI